MHQSIVYVSTPAFAPSQASAIIPAIAVQSKRRNAAYGITGALIATEHHFAQVIEGARTATEPLMANILRDPRHRDVKIVQHRVDGPRRFPGWSLAYQGQSAYFESFIRALLSEREPRQVDVDRLVDLMTRLAAPQPRRSSHDYRSS